MQKKKFFLICIGLMYLSSLSGQCPDNAVIWKRLVFLSDSSNISPKEQLRELLNNESSFKACLHVEDSVYAYLLQRIGVMYYLQSDYLLAIKYTRQAIHIVNNNIEKPYINPRRLINCYKNLVFYYNYLNRIAEKNNSIDSVTEIALRTKSVDKEIIYLGQQRVEYLFDIGDYSKCTDYADSYSSIANEYIHDGRERMEILIYFLIWKVEVQIAFKNYDLAYKLLADGIGQWPVKYIHLNLGVLYEELAEIQVYRKNYSAALQYFQKAIQYSESINDFINCKIVQNNIGYYIYFHGLSDYSKAIASFRKALSYVNKDDYYARLEPIENLNVLANIANVYAKQSRFDSAFTYFQLAFDQIKKGADEKKILNTPLEDFIQNKRIRYLISLFLDKGDAYFLLYKKTGQPDALSHAINVYKSTDQLLNKIKSEQTELASQLFWRSDVHRLYEHGIEASLLKKDTADIFYFFEKSRAVLLNDQLSLLSQISNDDILARAQFKKKILSLEQTIELADPSSKQDREAREELLTCKQKLERLEQSIKKYNLPYYNRFFDTSFITLQDVQKNLLKDHQALLELFEGDSSVYSFIITAAGSDFKKINKNDFDSTAQNYLSYLSNQSLLNRKFREYTSVANHLYSLIFGSFSLPAGRMIISPDGQYFPFEALVTSLSSAAPVFLVNDQAISYTYSARYLMNDFAANKSDTIRDLLGLAPVQYNSSFSLPALLGSDHSLDKIGSYYNDAKILIGNQASRNNFLHQYSKYKIIQLYTHATDSGRNGEPVIHFADSALYLSELIAENQPSTRLIVLSACETGKGKFQRGEGVFSFNREFAAIGIPSSIVNLWSVDNMSTYALTELFYKYLSKGMPVDIALQKAKLEFMQTSSQNRLPYYWAAAIVAGKTEILVEKKNNKWKYITAILVICAALSFWGWKRSRSR